MARLMIDMYKLLSSYQGVTLYTRCLIWDADHIVLEDTFSDIIPDLMKNPVLSEVSKITSPLNEYFVKSFQKFYSPI